MDLLTIARCVGIFNRQTQAYITAACSGMEVSFSEYILLMNLYGNEGINQEELASVLFIDKAAAARTIKTLESKNYLLRKVMTNDRRAKSIFLTDKGRECQPYFYSLLKKWEDFTTGGMDADTRKAVFQGLQAMAAQAANADLAKLTKQVKEGTEDVKSETE